METETAPQSFADSPQQLSPRPKTQSQWMVEEQHVREEITLPTGLGTYYNTGTKFSLFCSMRRIMNERMNENE